MRELTCFEDEATARTLRDVLFVDGIDSEVKQSRDGTFVVWVVDETDLDAARELAQSYERNQDASRFADASRRAKALRKKRAEQDNQARHRNIEMRRRWQATQGIGRLTGGLIVVSVLVSLLSRLGEDSSITSLLTIASYTVDGDYVRWHGLDDLSAGQLWRLVTPIFVHFGILHILFNMLWLKDLGTMIEQRQSSRFLAGLVLATAIIPNLAQYVLGGSPLFGGMSGVVYGLLGYTWIRGKVDPERGYTLPQPLIVWMLGWLVLGFTGLAGPIANYAHLGGLVVGGGVGWLAPQWRRKS